MIDEFYVAQERRATDFKAPKLWKSTSGRHSQNHFTVQM